MAAAGLRALGHALTFSNERWFYWAGFPSFLIEAQCLFAGRSRLPLRDSSGIGLFDRTGFPLRSAPIGADTAGDLHNIAVMEWLSIAHRKS